MNTNFMSSERIRVATKSVQIKELALKSTFCGEEKKKNQDQEW